MGASVSVGEQIAEQQSQRLVAEFQAAVKRAAGVEEASCGMDGKCQENKLKLKDLFEKADTNHDGVLDKNELGILIEKLHFEMSDELRMEMRSNMKSLLMTLGSSSFSLFFDQFMQVVGNTRYNVCNSKIVSKEPKRIVFVGGTGAGKSALCTALTGQSKKHTKFKVGCKASSETIDCSHDLYRWFGDESEEQFMCVDTPGLDDELGRDAEHINSIIDYIRNLEYVNAIVLVVNGQNPRFSTSLQTMIKEFEKAFTSRFYEHSIICLTRWYMDPSSIEEREEDDRTEESVTAELNSKICNSSNLFCSVHLPVVFVDSFYEKKDPRHGRERLAEICRRTTNEVFRTAELSKVKPKIVEVTNMDQIIRRSTAISAMLPHLFDPKIDVKEWSCEPSLPLGLNLCPDKGAIYGSPEQIVLRTDYKLRARSVGGWSEDFVISIEVAHSEADIRSIVLRALKPLEDELELLLPIDGEEAYDENSLKQKTEIAAQKGQQITEAVIGQLEAQYGNFSTFSDITSRVRAAGERAVLAHQNDFLVQQQQQLSNLRLRDKAEKDLEIQLIRETTNHILLQSYIADAEKMGAKEELIEQARSYLASITPANCCHSAAGCSFVGMERMRKAHEQLCLFSLPLLTKDSVKRTKASNADTSLVVKSTTAESSNWDGKYDYEANASMYFTINQAKQRIQVLHKADKDTPTGEPVEWVFCLYSQHGGSETEYFRSINRTANVLGAKFKDFELEPAESYSWIESPQYVHPSSNSLKILYFGGKWCPYCPPFTAILSRFFKSIRQQKGDNAIDVIFISSDQSENAMFEYFVEEHGDWMAIPYSERDIKDVMSSNFEITGIPGCKVVNSRMEVVPDIEMRRLLSALPDTAGPKLNVEALKLYEKLCSAVKSTDDSSVGLADKEVVDIFFSLRFGEAMDQAVMVRKLLKEQYDINGCIIEVPPGQDIAEQVAEKLNSAKMVLIFGTETYGTGTVNFSTKEELQFLMDEKKPFFLIKMCEKFSVARTRLSLSNAVSYVKWNPGDPVPDNLISEIANKFEDAVLNPTAHY